VYSEDRYGYTIITCPGFGARMTINSLDIAANLETRTQRTVSQLEGIGRTQRLVDTSKIPNGPGTAELLSKFQAMKSMLANPAVIRSIDVLKYLPPKAAEKAVKK
jgi:cellulose biosynthesis protein BcsQ